jgi:hypothetical protein
MNHTRLTQALTLRGLIEILKSFPRDFQVWDLTNDHSYRGYYRDLAFEVADYKNDIESLIEWLETLNGKEYQGWRGGNFTMGPSTRVWIAEEGTTIGSGMILGYDEAGNGEWLAAGEVW